MGPKDHIPQLHDCREEKELLLPDICCPCPALGLTLARWSLAQGVYLLLPQSNSRVCVVTVKSTPPVFPHHRRRPQQHSQSSDWIMSVQFAQGGG